MNNSDPGMHPLCVLWSVIFYFFSVLISRTWLCFIILFMLQLIVSLLLRTGIRHWWGVIRSAWLLILVTFVIHALLSSGNNLSEGIIKGFERNIVPSLMLSAFFVGRFVLMILAVSLLFRLHPPQRYAREMGRMASKIPGIGRIAGQLELTGTIALRFIPFLHRENQRIQFALKARGMISGRNWIERIARQQNRIYPLLLSALRKADYVAFALTARGYNPKTIRTSYLSEPIRLRDIVAALGISILCIIAVRM